MEYVALNLVNKCPPVPRKDRRASHQGHWLMRRVVVPSWFLEFTP
jgi:hypothetical protein